MRKKYFYARQEGATKANPADDRSHGDAASTTPSAIPANTPSTPIGSNGTKSDPANLLVELEKILAGLDVHVKDLDAELEEQCAKVRAATRELQQARHEITTMADQPAFVHRRDEDVELMHVPSAPMADGDHNAAAAREWPSCNRANTYLQLKFIQVFAFIKEFHY